MNKLHELWAAMSPEMRFVWILDVAFLPLVYQLSRYIEQQRWKRVIEDRFKLLSEGKISWGQFPYVINELVSNVSRWGWNKKVINEAVTVPEDAKSNEWVESERKRLRLVSREVPAGSTPDDS